MNKLTTKSITTFTAIAIVCGFGRCKSEPAKEIPDVSSIVVTADLDRFEKTLAEVDTALTTLDVGPLLESYPDFFRCFSENILTPPTPIDSTTLLNQRLRKMLAFEGFQAAYDSTMLQYNDVEWLEADLTQAFKYLRYYFPSQPVPRVVTFVSEYQFGAVICTDSTIAIGLDLFLGEDFVYYPAIGIPGYRLPKMGPEYIMPNLMRVMAHNMIGQWSSDNTLLAQMIHNGKIAAFIDALMPFAPDHLKIDYTAPQQAWCEDNENQVWAYFKGEDLLYKQSKLEYMKFINDAPGTPGMPPEAPGNIGSWVGWQIVKKYMEETGASIKEVMLEPDAQRILERSRYKPKR